MPTLEKFRLFAGWMQGTQKLTSPADLWIQRNLSDSVLQLHLDSAISQVKSLLAFSEDEDLPDHPRVDQSVYTLCLHFLHNRSSDNQTFTFKTGIVDVSSSNQYADRIEPHIYKRCIQLINPWRRVDKFQGVSA